MEEARERVIQAAIEWRQHCALAGPTDKHPTRRPVYSGALADAIDALRTLREGTQ